MVLQWATKRLCKFFLKRLNKFLNEEIDVEQLDVQLGSGTGTLTDLVLNVDYVNEQIKSLPVLLKFGSIARIVVRLPCEIELFGLELLAAPRHGCKFTPGVSKNVAGNSSEEWGRDTGGTYMGVSDGVRMIGQMIKNILLGLRVTITNINIGVEGSGNYIGLQIPSLKYGYVDEDSINLVKAIKFENVTLEVGTDRKARILEEDGLSGLIRVTIPCKEAAESAFAKINFDISIEPVRFKASVSDLTELFLVAHSYLTSGATEEGSIYHDTSSFHEPARSVVFDTKPVDSSPSTSRSTLSVIADWMCKPGFSEPDLAASMDEFFECFDAWNQSATGSDIWNWTRSAFGAASVSDMVAETSQDIQMECSVTARFKSLSAILLYDSGPDGFELTLKDTNLSALISREDSKVDAGVHLIECTQLGYSSEHKRLQSMSEAVLPYFPVRLHDDIGLTIFKVTSSSEHPAVSVVVKHNQHSNAERGSLVRAKVSIALQPLILWVDVDTVNKLTQACERFQASTGCSRQEEVLENPVESSCKVDLSVTALRACLTAADRQNSGCFLAFDVGVNGAKEAQAFRYDHQKGTRGQHRSVTLTATQGVLYSIVGSSLTEVVRIRSDSRGKARLTIKWSENNKAGSWIAKKVWDGVAATKKKYTGSGTSNLEFASATALDSDSNYATLGLLREKSSCNVHVSLPRVAFTLSDSGPLCELLASFTTAELDSEVSCPQRVSQTMLMLTFEVGEIEAVVDVAQFVDVPKKGMKLYDVLQLRSTKLKVVAGLALGGVAGASYIHIKLGDGEILERTRNAELVCWKSSSIGRGDGGALNALSKGTAGLSMNLVFWPGGGQQQDLILTGSMGGATFFTEGGNFDWLPAMVKFLEQRKKPFLRTSSEQALDSAGPNFVFDLHDVALCYEPTTESMSSIGCVLAAAAFRISSGEPASSKSEQYCISFKDLALHLVDTKLRKRGSIAGESLQTQGYVQVAKAPVVGALAKLSVTESPSWEVVSADNHLYFDTCSDTTTAFGQLVSDLQQLFAPDIQESVELQLRTMKGKSTVNVPSTANEGPEDLQNDITEGLFEGVVENAFARAKVVEVKEAGCSASGTVYQEASVRLFEPSGPCRKDHQPTFIEDYYLMSHTSTSSNQDHETSTSNQALDNDVEARGGWYEDSCVDVFDTHVSQESSSPKKSDRKETHYPQAIGRVILNGWKVRWRLYGGSDWTNARQLERCVEVSVGGMDVNYDTFGPTGLYASSLLVEIHDFHVYDYSADARWKLILGYYHKRSRPRESTSKAVTVRMDAVRPNPMAPLEEYRLSLALLPICLHIDQAHVDFFGKFFQSDNNADDAFPSASSAVNDDAILPFFQVCDMRPLIIRVDYIPRRIDFGALRSGNCFELFNMVSWKGVELQLKSVHTSGVYGWSSLMGLLLGEWLEDIFPRQVHKLLRAFGPIRPLYAVSSGAAKLIVFPAEQYMKDRRVLRGMRKGAIAFLQSISVEALGLGANLAAGAHHILLHTEMGLGGRIPSEKKDAKRKFQPSDTREGFQQACESLAQGLERTAISLVGNPVKVYQRGGSAGVAVASAIKASPAAILAPASAAADAVRHALLGVRNGLDPDRKREYDEKHRGDAKRWR